MARRTLVIGFALVALIVGFSGFAAPELAQASAPSAPLTGGTFTVDTASDNTAVDSYLSLREAMLIARGGTGATGLNRALTNGEKNQLIGCTIDGGNFITGGCGATITDSIHFDLSSGATIALLSSLPAINDTAPTIIDGGLVFPVIDGWLMGSGNALYIYSSYNTLEFLTIKRAPTTNILNTGSHNTFFAVTSINAGLYGMSLSGSYNTVDTSLIGISSNTEWNCNTVPSGNGSHGIFIPGGAHHNTIENTDIGCNGGNGIEVEPSVTDGHHTFGPNNKIGTNDISGSLGNNLYGIDLGTDWNVVHSSTVIDNQGGGIGISADSNNIYGAIVRGNDLDGIKIYGTAANNRIGCTGDCFWSGTTIGNIVMDNFGPGLLITGTSVNHTYVMGNRIGVDGGGGAHWNTAEGILIYGSSSNYIGDGLSSTYLNWIGTHKYADNIRIDGGASSNTIANNLIFSSSYNGVRITGGAHDNTIGGPTAAYSNTISGNTLDGVYISGNNNTVNANRITTNANGVHLTDSSANNIIGENSTAKNYIYINGVNGIAIDGSANHNTIGSNAIGLNALSQAAGNNHNGVYITESAHDNTIGDATHMNSIQHSGQNGILLDGMSVANNKITSNDSRYNQLSGLAILGAHHTVVTVDGMPGNSFAFNDGTGIFLSACAHDNLIGFNNVNNNKRNGIELNASCSINNVFSGTLMTANLMDGINEHGSATKNSWRHISTFANHGLGIDKAATSDTSNTITGPFPTITSASQSGGNVTVSGTASPSLFQVQTVTVELYATYLDTTGVAEGKTYVGSTQTDLGTGTWSITYPASSSGCYVAFQTIYDFASDSNTSSEFGPNSCHLSLPLIMR